MDTETAKLVGGSGGKLLHGDISDRVLAAFFTVYGELGSGFLEAVYSRAFSTELQILGA
jgi:hypothetical protein